MGKLTDLLKNTQKKGPLSSLLGVTPSKFEPTRTSQADIAQQALSEAEKDVDRFKTATIDLNKPKSLEEQAKIDDFKRRQVLAEAEQEPETLLGSIIKPENLPSNLLLRGGAKLFDKATGKDLSANLEGAMGAGIRQIPFIGEQLTTDKELAALRQESSSLGKLPEAIPFVGGKEIKATELGSLGGQLFLTAAQYGAVNKAIDKLGKGSKLGQLVGQSKKAKFAAAQGADLLADVIIQTPQEAFDAIKNDDSLGEFAKTTLTNRAWDIAINAVIGGAMEVGSLRNQAKLDKKGFEEAIAKVSREQGDQIRKAIGVEVPLSPALKQADTLKQVDDVTVGPLKTIDETLQQTTKEIPQDVQPKQKLSNLLKDDTGQIKPEFTKVEPVKVDETKVGPTIDGTGSPRVSDFPEPVVGKSKSPFIDRVKDLVSDDPTVSKLKRDLKELELSTTSNEARTLAAKEIVNQDLDAALKIVKEGDRFGSTIESEMGRSVVDALNAQGRNAEAIEVISKMSEKFRSAGKDVQAASIWSKTSPEGMQKWATDTLNNAEVKIDPKLIEEVGQDMKRIQDMSVEELAKMVADKTGGNPERTLKAIEGSFNYDQLKAVNTAITMNKVIGKIPVLKARKLSSLQAMSHLLNVKTFNRNILGNAASLLGEWLSKVPASIADRGLSMMTGNRSVVAGMPSFKKSMLEGWNQGKRSFFEIKAGVGKGKTGKYEALFGDTFKTKAGKGAERLMSWSLQTPDEFFKGFTKADSLYNQLAARLGPKVKKWEFDEIMNKATMEEIDTAIKESEFATFQNDSMLAGLLSGTKKGLNKASTAIGERVPGMKNLFTKDFGLGDMVVKYTRVPGNIMTRGFEYSPLGYLKAGEGLFKMMNNLDLITPQQQRELALKIGRATTGTGLLFLGKKLNDLGIITDVDGGTDYNAQAFERAEGLGNYKINMDALSRLIKGQDPTKQAGDTLKSFNWAAPMVTPIAVGAKLVGEEGKSVPDTVKSLALNTFEESMDLPSLFIVKQMMYEGMKEGSTPMDIASVPLKEAIPGFVPSVVRQGAQLLDPKFRDTSGGANVPILKQLTPLLGESATGKIQSNIPGISKLLPEKLDVLGREQERQKGIFPSLIDPSTTTKFTPTAFGDKLRTIEDITGESNFFPDRKPPNSITYRGEKLLLTPEEKKNWQKAEGNQLNELYTDLLSDIEITTDNAEVVAKTLSKMKSVASKIAKSQLLESRFGGN